MATYEAMGQEPSRSGNGGRTEEGHAQAAEAAETRRRVEEARTLGALFRELTEESTAFVRAEVALARREASEKMEVAQRGAVLLAGAGVVAIIGLWALTAAVIWALATAMPVWAASLIVGVAVLGLGGAMLALGMKSLERKRLEPERTMRSLRATRTMAEEHLG